MVGKRGMSPIIATILLIAFAVAIGAMIMNFGTSYAQGASKESACDGAKIILRNPICFKSNKIKLDITSTNTETDIEGIVMKIYSENSDQDIHVKNSRMIKNDVIVREMPVIKPEDFTIELYAKVMVDEEPEVCPNSLHITNELPNC